MPGFEELLGMTNIGRTPPRPDKPSTSSIRHPMYRDLDGRFWPIVVRELEMTTILTEDIERWDAEVDPE